jgi:CRISPR/Cas system-associated endonuclease Cas1
MTPHALAESIRNRLFADRDNFNDALDYAYSIAKGTDNPAAVMTAVMVVVNTLANYIEQTEVDKGLVDQ